MKQEIKSESYGGSTAVLKTSNEKTTIISIPAHIILNEAGVSFFIKHDRPLCSFEDSDGSDRFGFVMKTIDFAWLKKMLLKGFVEKIELEIQEIARSS